jgi:hypothetical protein
VTAIGDGDIVEIVMDTPELAGEACRAHNDGLAGETVKASAVRLLEEAFFLRVNGEHAPGGSENWHDWDLKAETFLRGLLPPEAPESGAEREGRAS